MAKLTDYLTIPEAAELIGCHQNSVRKWIRGGHIKSVTRFGRHLIKRKDCKRPDTLDPRGGHGFGIKKETTTT